MRVIGGVVIAIAVIFGTISFASATEDIPLIKDTRGLEPRVNFADVKTVYEIVLIPHPCDPLSNELFHPDDPVSSCAEDFVDDELLDFISDMALEAIGFPINIDDLLFPEVTNLNDLEQQIIQLGTTSKLIFEHEAEDLTITSQFEEEIKAEYQNIKDKWKKEMNELKNNANVLFKENPGMKSKILELDIEKLKIKFDLKEKKIKNAEQVQKKIKTAIELKNLKKEFFDSMNEYAIIELTMKYGSEKNKKLEQINDENMKLMNKMLISESKHDDKKLDEDDFKKIEKKVAEEIFKSHGDNSEKIDSDDWEIEKIDSDDFQNGEKLERSNNHKDKGSDDDDDDKDKKKDKDDDDD